MPKLDLNAIATTTGSDYPAPFHEPVSRRARQRLGDARALTQFGVNRIELPPGCWSGQRHWHALEDELVYVIAGELVLVTDQGEQVLSAGDCAAFPANTPNAHHLVNRSAGTAVCLEVGSRNGEDRVVYADIDMVYDATADAYFYKDGTAYPSCRKQSQ
ncbi:MAG: cupin domain-containing protein [Telluria sp.]